LKAPTDIEKAMQALRDRPSLEKRIQPVKSRAHFLQRREALRTRLDRAALRRLCKPENARELAEAMPDADTSVHALITGNFIFADLLGSVIGLHGKPLSLTIATLSLSKKNISMLSALLEKDPFPIFFLISHYFSRTNKDIFAALQSAAEQHPSLSIRVARTHCKIALLDYPENAWCIETSANLRSSGNLEQVTILNDRGLLNFHREWMTDPSLPTQ
jgi:hypothetical protein